MIKIVLIMIVTAAVLVVTDDWVRAKRYPPEQDPLHQVDRTHKGNRVHLDVWLIEYGAVKWVCVLSPCGRKSLFSIDD